MLTAYFIVLAAAMAAAFLYEASRPAAAVMAGSWAVSYLSEAAGLRGMAPYIDLAALWAMLLVIGRWPSRAPVNAAHFLTGMVLAHLVFTLSYYLGLVVPGAYMWTLNLLFLAGVLSLIGPMRVAVWTKGRLV